MQKEALRQNCASPTMYMCICCKQLRGFIVDAATASKTAWAKGNHKVLYDDYTGDLYCGRKVEKATQRETGETSYWKYQQAQMCTKGKLISHNLLGNILALNGTMYSLCASCACKMEITNDRFYGNMFCCVHCQYKKTQKFSRTCCHCMQRCTYSTTYKCSDTDINICSRCTRCWLGMSVVRNMTANDVHIAINDRWSRNHIIVKFG